MRRRLLFALAALLPLGLPATAETEREFYAPGRPVTEVVGTSVQGKNDVRPSGDLRNRAPPP